MYRYPNIRTFWSTMCSSEKLSNTCGVHWKRTLLPTLFFVYLFLSCKAENYRIAEPPIKRLASLALHIVNEVRLPHNRYLIISEYTCQTCLEYVLRRGDRTAVEIPLAIIIIGGDDDVIRHFNAVYKRQNITFRAVSREFLAQLEKIDPKLVYTLFVGVKRDDDGNVTIYDGAVEGKDEKDESQRIADVVHFLVE